MINLFFTEPEACKRIILVSYIKADVFLLTYKVTNPHHLDNIQSEWAEKVRHVVPGGPIILVGTHFDKKEDIPAEQDLDGKLAEVAKTVGADKCMEVSAKDGTDVEELLRAAVKLGLEFREREKAKKAKSRKCALL